MPPHTVVEVPVVVSPARAAAFRSPLPIVGAGATPVIRAVVIRTVVAAWGRRVPPHAIAESLITVAVACGATIRNRTSQGAGHNNKAEHCQNGEPECFHFHSFLLAERTRNSGHPGKKGHRSQPIPVQCGKKGHRPQPHPYSETDCHYRKLSFACPLSPCADAPLPQARTSNSADLFHGDQREALFLEESQGLVHVVKAEDHDRAVT